MRLSVILKYSVPGFAPVTSVSRYADAPASGNERFKTIAGGTIDAEMFCVAPVIVRFAVTHEVVDAGHTFTANWLCDGEMVLLSGTARPAKEPVPSSVIGPTVVLILNGTPFWK